MINLIKWIPLEKHADSRGALTIAEANRNIPFDIKRVYCLTKMNIEPRGFHAHIDLQQVMVCLSGSCNITLDNGRHREIVLINADREGLFIDKMVWREMHDFSQDCVLMVLASSWYDEGDYIRCYNDFIGKLQ